VCEIAAMRNAGICWDLLEGRDGESEEILGWVWQQQK